MQEMLSNYLSNNKESFVSKTIVALFQQAAKWYPEKEAVKLMNTSMTYRALDRSSDALAKYLVKHENVKEGDVVVVSAVRSIEAIAIIMGIWKTGAAYVAVDPECPSAYNESCMRIGKPNLCVDVNYLHTAVNSEGDASPFKDRSRPDQLALVLFTSGSTGKPKGVRLLHSNISASASNFDSIPFYSSDVFASLASLLFVAFVYDLAISMALGCTLHLVPTQIRKNIQGIADFYVENKITVAFLPPHMAQKYMKVDQNSPLRMLLVGSEPPRNLQKRPYQIVNVFASSEACAIISHYDLEDHRSRYPIGKLVPAIRGYIVTEEGTLAKEGEIGELWISGPQVFDGYVDLPELNQERIIPNPFDCAPAY